MPDHLPEATQMVYAQLLDELLGAALPGRGITFVQRESGGRRYWYMNFVIGEERRSHYLGADSDALRARIDAAKEAWARDEQSARQRAASVAMLRVGGAVVLPARHARVIEALAQAGVFLVGGVLVGSHAFALMGNMLGVRWDSGLLRTEDVDIAHDDRIHVSVPGGAVDIEEVPRETDGAFFAVPALDRKHPFTSFAIRGSRLSVSLLTPMRGRPDSTPRRIPALRAMAEPLRFLDFLLEDTQPAVLPVRSGVLVVLPSPARFALHKLVVSQCRPAAFANKARKDVAQAEQVLEVLVDERPGDVVLAAEAVAAQPAKFRRQLEAGLALVHAELREEVSALLAGDVG